MTRLSLLAAVLFSPFLALSVRADPTTAPAVVQSAPIEIPPPQVPLPPGMTPLFNGTSLDGWIQDPHHFSSLSAADFTDMADFVKKISSKSDPVSTFINGKLDDPGQAALTALVADATDTAKIKAFVKSLNVNVINGDSIYDATRFQNVQLSPDTQDAVKSNPTTEDDITWQNRLLLADAYPSEIRPPVARQDPWIVKNGAMASTGAGRGTIYTAADYTNYRIIFDIRHVSGKPDHQACVLVFCTRPPDGKKGMDAIGGVQFQVPNAGHWDYRPGKNTGGKNFTQLAKGKFDIHQWSRVEILVNTTTGTARMAVAQPVGSKAVELLDFKDSAIPAQGPFALQMHNAGLFDEYANIAIEVNPTVDDLITTK